MALQLRVGFPTLISRGSQLPFTPDLGDPKPLATTGIVLVCTYPHIDMPINT